MNLVSLIAVCYMVGLAWSNPTCTDTAKTYPYVFGLNQTATNKTNSATDPNKNIVDVNIENIITDSSQATYIAVTASSKCYFEDPQDCTKDYDQSDAIKLYRGLIKVKGDQHQIVWKIGLTKRSTAENERNQVVAMALKADESRLAVMYHQPYPNAKINNADNGTTSRIVLRVFDTANGNHITTHGQQVARYYLLYFGKYTKNSDMIYLASGSILFNQKYRESTQFAGRLYLYDDTKANDFRGVGLLNGAPNAYWGESYNYFITGLSAIYNSDRSKSVFLVHYSWYLQHGSDSSKFAWPGFSQVTVPAMTVQSDFAERYLGSSVGKTLHIAALLGRIDGSTLYATIVTQRSYRAFKDFWDDFGVAESGKEQFYGQRFKFDIDGSGVIDFNAADKYDGS